MLTLSPPRREIERLVSVALHLTKLRQSDVYYMHNLCLPFSLHVERLEGKYQSLFIDLHAATHSCSQEFYVVISYQESAVSY